jgi:glycosyltransferase involved in cell wall biosynthesis
MNTLSIVIPVYNEAKTIAITLEKIKLVNLQNNITKQLVIVNDCSTDDSLAVVEIYKNNNPDVAIKIYSHPVNKGKGAALHTGIAAADGDFVVIQDADLEYNPEEYKILLQPILDGAADVVYGSRFMGGRPHRILFFWHTIGNKFLTQFSNMFANLNLSDMETCYKMFKADIIKSIHLKEKRFGFEPEVTQKVARIKNIRIYEVGISYYGRTYEEGKKIGWKDGVRALYCILKYGLFKSA